MSIQLVHPTPPAPDYYELARSFIAIKRKIASCEKELEELESSLLEHLTQTGNPITCDGYTLSLGKRDNYRYSPATQSLAAELKIQQAHERLAGIAEVTKTTFFIRCDKKED